MKHTKGEMITRSLSNEIVGIFEPDNPKKNKGWAIAECQGPDKHANAERMVSLWNAADGLTTEQAVAYLKHGAEMAETLRYWANNTPNSYPTEAIISRAKDIIKKMEATK